MKKVPKFIVIHNSASDQSPAVISCVDAEGARILIHYSDGSIKQIFKGKRFLEDQWWKKVEAQKPRKGVPTSNTIIH